MDKTYQRRPGFLSLAILLTLWGVWGLIGDNRGYTDALYEPDYTIRHVPAGGVLEQAGFQPGDSVLSVEGRAIQALGMYSRWPLSLSRSAGDSIRMVVDRDGTWYSGTIVYRDPPPGARLTRWTLALFAFSFLWLGIWLLFTVRTPDAQRLTMVGLVVAFAVPGPYLGSYNGVQDHLGVAAEILFLILLLHFLLLFPKAKRLARSPLVGLLYLPWLVLLGCLVVEVALHPRLYHTFGGFIGVLFLGYLVAAVLVLAHSTLTTPRDQWSSSGVGLIVGGWAVALLPNAIVMVGWMTQGGWSVPGERYFPLLLVAIPVSMALAVRRAAATFNVAQRETLR